LGGVGGGVVGFFGVGGWGVFGFLVLVGVFGGGGGVLEGGERKKLASLRPTKRRPLERVKGRGRIEAHNCPPKENLPRRGSEPREAPSRTKYSGSVKAKLEPQTAWHGGGSLRNTRRHSNLWGEKEYVAQKPPLFGKGAYGIERKG